MFGRRSVLAIAGFAFVAIITAGLSLFGTQIRTQIFARAMPQDFFGHFNTIEPQLYQVSGAVYAYEAGYARSLILRTQDGIAVFDTFSVKHANELMEALEHEFPGEDVKWVLHSHHHFDHIRGSVVFEGAAVIGHKDINRRIADFSSASQTVARTTRSLSGDQTIVLGNVEVEALYMPNSHSDTLYAFRIPSEGVVFAPDMMFVDHVPPFGFPDFYHPGYIRALDRLIALNAIHYVPTHGWRGDRDDLIAYRNMEVDMYEFIEAELIARIDRAEEDSTIAEILRVAYPKLREKYGHLHGFDTMFIAKFGRKLGGAFLGY